MTHIALVDDDRNILTSVSMALEAEGYDVRTYTDGATALAALTTSPPDLAVLHIKMPRLDGIDLLRRLPHHTLPPRHRASPRPRPEAARPGRPPHESRAPSRPSRHPRRRRRRSCCRPMR